MAEPALQTQAVIGATPQQQTLAREVSLSGTGLHLGEPVTVTFRPAEPERGITFLRSDLPGHPTVQAHASMVVDTTRAPRRTSIGAGPAEVHTVEHAMAALWGMGVDNAVVEVTGPELPGLDGSAQPFIRALKEAGTVTQAAPRKFFTLREPLWIESDGDAAIAALPHPEFRISYTLSYNHPMLKAQFAFFNGHESAGFEEAIAPARTFCLEREAEELRRHGLGKGANYENTLVVGNGGVIQNQLRFEDEFVRHKVLDLIGDLYLLGMPLKAHIIALKSGHALNLKLLRKLLWVMERSRDGAIRSGATQAFAGPELDINAIRQILPHRYPFLLVDRIVELEPDRRAVGLKNVTANEQFFQGHFPNRPVMPGVLLIEAMAQVGGVLLLSKREHQGKYVYFMSADKVKFRKAVIPGDQLVLTATVERFRGKTGYVTASATVDGRVAAEAQLGFALVES